MARTVAICGLLVLCATGVSNASDLEDLVEAERGFAKAAATDGMRDAFLAVLAKDAILFRPRPVNAARIHRRRSGNGERTGAVRFPARA